MGTSLAKTVSNGFLAGDYDEVYIVYTNFVSILTQSVGCLQLLPLLRQETSAPSGASQMVYEPDAEAVFAAIAGALILHERMLPAEFIGSAIMFVAIILVQLPEKKKQ